MHALDQGQSDRITFPSLPTHSRCFLISYSPFEAFHGMVPGNGKERISGIRTQGYFILRKIKANIGIFFTIQTKTQLIKFDLPAVTWKTLPGRWAGLAGSPVYKRWGSFWWWRSTWKAGWTNRVAPDQTPQWGHRSPAFSPWLTGHSSPGSYRPPGTRCQTGSTC